MTERNHNDEPMDMRLFQKLQKAREDGGITDDDRVVFFHPDEPVRLHSAFGHGADDRMFDGIVAANFRALNPRPVSG